MSKFKIKMTVEYEVEYPDDFDDSMVDFHLTESSWCARQQLIQKPIYTGTGSEQARAPVDCVLGVGGFESFGPITGNEK